MIEEYNFQLMTEFNVNEVKKFVITFCIPTETKVK